MDSDFGGVLQEEAIKSKLTNSKADKANPDKEKAQEPRTECIIITLNWVLAWE